MKTPKARFIVSVVYILALTISCAGVIFYFLQKQSLNRQQENARIQTLERMIRVSGESLLKKKDSIFLDYLRAAMPDSFIVAVTLEAADGAIIAHSDFLKGDKSLKGKKVDAAGLAWKQSPSHEIIEDSAPVLVNNKKLAVLRIFFDGAAFRETVNTGLQQASLPFIGAALGAFFAGILITFLMSSRSDRSA